MDDRILSELKKLYLKKKRGEYLTTSEREALKIYLEKISITEKRSLIIKTASAINESEEDIETFIEKDIKRN